MKTKHAVEATDGLMGFLREMAALPADWFRGESFAGQLLALLVCLAGVALLVAARKGGR
jgi:hypothetical protein